MQGQATTVQSSVRQSHGAAEAAAARSNAAIEALSTVDDLVSASGLLDRIWASPHSSPMPSELLRAFCHTGGYVGGARVEGRLVGALVGFLALFRGELVLHSQILGVDPELRDRGIGFALKLHQRAWALGHGISTITWTFDPLVSRNVYFNLTRLGAEALEYHVNFYGAVQDAINGGDETDRLLAVWRLDGDQAVEASENRPAKVDAARLQRAGAAIAVEPAADGSPLVSPMRDGVLLCRIPPDISVLRQQRPAMASAWRFALRETLGNAVSRGLPVRGFARSGWYVVGELPQATT